MITKRNKKVSHIAVLTGGGDAPALNAVIRAVVKAALNLSIQVTGVIDGFEGLILNRLMPLTNKEVSGILPRGGTILGTTNRANPFSYPVKYKGKVTLKDVSNRIVKRVKKNKIDCLIVIGGDGSLQIATKLYKKGIPIIGIPKTIDNDLEYTDITFGFDTAVNNATDALDKLHTTAESHHRIIILEVMGRYAGWIALSTGIAGGADVILIPEIPFDIKKIAKKIHDRDKRGVKFSTIVVSEGARMIGGKMVVKNKNVVGREVILGGIADFLADKLKKYTKHEIRTVVLGHLQRGGQPTTFDRLLGTRFGAAAVRLAAKGEFGKMVCLKTPTIKAVPLEFISGKMKLVPIDWDPILSAKAMGISFGD